MEKKLDEMRKLIFKIGDIAVHSSDIRTAEALFEVSEELIELRYQMQIDSIEIRHSNGYQE